MTPPGFERVSELVLAALDILIELLGETARESIRAMSKPARIYRNNGQLADAEPLYKTAINFARRETGPLAQPVRVSGG